MAALSPALWRILDLWVCVALKLLLEPIVLRVKISTIRTHLVCVPEPGRSLLLAAHKRNPLVAAPTQALPHVGVTIHAPCLLWFLERVASGGTDAVGEALIVPEGRILQDQPPTGLADPTPAFSLVAMAAHPPGSVEIAVESKLLFMGDEVWVGRVHVLGWRWDLFLV